MSFRTDQQDLANSNYNQPALDKVWFFKENRLVAPLLWLKKTRLDGLGIASA